MDSVRENFFANECKPAVLKRIVSKESEDNKVISKVKSSAQLKSIIPTEDKSKSDKAKPKGPPPPPPPPQLPIPKSTVQQYTPNDYNDDDNDDDDANIPKTGFDFLDDW